MKNFKKVLALVLVVAMVMAFATVSTAAFTDASSITKAQAVDVLSAIGVINGYEDGSFKPEGNVTRAEMAKMIATILNKGEDVGTMYAGACTFADSAKHWAAGYIAYCAQEGIINGKNATTFDPDANVTGTEAAKMVLGALGHKADKAGLTGASWASQTLSLAKKYNLIGEQNNMTANMGVALNRENAAQLLLNGLKATMVEYTGGTNITIGNIVLNQGAKAEELTNTSTSYDTATNDGKLQLVEEYFPRLTVTASSADAFGRECDVWEYEETVGSYNVAPYKTYTTAITMGQLYTDLGKVGNADLSATPKYYVDGEEIASGTAYENLTTKLASGDLNEIGGQGVITEVYFDAQAMTLRVCQINVYAAEIASPPVPAVKDSNGDITAAAYVTINYLYGGKAATTPQYQLNGNKLSANNAILTDEFTAADKGAIVYYTIGDDIKESGYQKQLQTIAKATAVTGANGGFAESATDTVVSTTVGGTTYNVNVNAQGAGKYGATFGANETIYLDANNNVIYTTGVASNDYLLVLNNAKSAALFEDGYSAKVVLSDGTEKVVELAAVHNNGVDNNKIYSYIVDTDGKYTLSNGVNTTVAGDKVTNKVPTLVDKDGENPAVYADANTIFVVGEKDTSTGATTYTTYTGISAVPTFQANTANTIYYVTNSTGSAAVVFCADAALTGASTTAIMALYKTGNESKVTAGVGNTYYAVKAVINGQTSTVYLTENAYTQGAWANGGTGFRIVSGGMTDAHGNYSTLTDVVSSGDLAQATAFTDFEAYKNGNITLGTAQYVENTVPVVVWNKDASALQVTTVEAVQAMTAGTTGYYTHELASVGGAVTGIYMTVDY